MRVEVIACPYVHSLECIRVLLALVFLDWSSRLHLNRRPDADHDTKAKSNRRQGICAWLIVG